MNASFQFPAQDLLKATKSLQVPDQVRAMAEEGVSQSRRVYEQFANLSEQNAKAAQEVLATVQDGAKVFSAKVMQNVSENTEATLKAAAEIAKAKTIQDALRLQLEFFQAQTKSFAAQSQELFQLSAGVSKSTAEKLANVATRTTDHFKVGI